ncbi:MAG: methyltransferase domain-containing protein [Chloroflexi bacterium]|nr:methyltransferase domain-containing protein [Chloroflexota bacterium]
MSTRSTPPEAARYAEFYGTPLGQAILEQEAKLIRRVMAGCRRILDVGCGPGAFAAALPELNLIGADRDAGMLREARRAAAGRDFVRGDAGHLPFRDGACDGLLYLTSLDFVADIEGAVAEGARVLGPGGRVLVMLLNQRSEYFRERAKRPGSYFARARRREPAAVREALARRFEIVEEGWFLGLQGEQVAAADEGTGALVVVAGRKAN